MYICRFTVHEAISGIVSACGQWSLLAGFGVAASMVGINFMMTEASLEAEEAVKGLLKPLETARTSLPPQEAVS